MKIINVVGARMNFVKIAPLMAYCTRTSRVLLHLLVNQLDGLSGGRLLPGKPFLTQAYNDLTINQFIILSLVGVFSIRTCGVILIGPDVRYTSHRNHVAVVIRSQRNIRPGVDARGGGLEVEVGGRDEEGIGPLSMSVISGSRLICRLICGTIFSSHNSNTGTISRSIPNVVVNVRQTGGCSTYKPPS